MDTPALLKAILIHAAYQGSAAVCQPLQVADGQPLNIDPLIQDAGLQKKGVLVYEEAKVQYNALLRAFHDHSGIWPDPKANADAIPSAGSPNLPSLLNQSVSLLARLPRETPMGTLGQFLDLVGKVSATTPTQPGQELQQAVNSKP